MGRTGVLIAVKGRINSNLEIYIMINKIKFAVPALALGLMFTSAVAFAQDTTGANSTASTSAATSSRKACLADAKSARVAAVKVAGDTARAAKAEAKNTEKTALAAAKANTDK